MPALRQFYLGLPHVTQMLTTVQTLRQQCCLTRKAAEQLELLRHQRVCLLPGPRLPGPKVQQSGLPCLSLSQLALAVSARKLFPHSRWFRQAQPPWGLLFQLRRDMEGARSAVPNESEVPTVRVAWNSPLRFQLR